MNKVGQEIVTKAQFNTFKKTCLTLKERFGLSGWDFYFEWKEIDVQASVSWIYCGKIATFTLCKKSFGKICARTCAIHELSLIHI